MLPSTLKQQLMEYGTAALLSRHGRTRRRSAEELDQAWSQLVSRARFAESGEDEESVDEDVLLGWRRLIEQVTF